MRIFRLILTLLHLALFLVLAAMFFNKVVPPSFIRWFNFIPLFFPVLITAYILLTIYWIISFKKRAILFLVGLLFFFNSIRRWANYSSQSPSPQDLKVIAYNVNGAKQPDSLKLFFEKEKPDIIFIEESSGKLTQQMKLPELPYTEEKHVLAIYSKYPIERWHKAFKTDGNGKGYYADVKIKGKTVRLVALYLEPFYLEKSMVKPTGNEVEDKRKARFLAWRLASSFDMHQQQVEQAVNIIQNSPYPVLLGGDFNSVPDSYEYYHLSHGLDDAFMTAGKGFGMSFYSFKYPIRIDYLFTSPQIKATSYLVDKQVDLSDHYPVIATFRMPQ